MQRDEVSSVRKALEILSVFSASTPELSVSAAGRSLGIPKSTAHNLLKTLQIYGFVVQDPADKLYRLGPRVFELGSLFSKTTQLVQVARTHLLRLADQTKETVKLAVLTGDEGVIVAGLESPFALHTRGDEGRRIPLHCGSLGKAMLAALPDSEVREIIARRGLARYTSQTITDMRHLEQEIKRIRGQGYAVDWEESEEGVRCVAATIIDYSAHSPAAVSISGPAVRNSEQRIREHATLVMETANQISRALREKSAVRARQRI